MAYLGGRRCIVSEFVLEQLDVPEGEQTRILQARSNQDIDHPNKVLLVARCIHERRGAHIAHQYKFAYDDVSESVFLATPDAIECGIMRGEIFDVRVATLQLVRVAKLTRHKPENDTYNELVISSYVLKDQHVSFTLQHFGIQVGEQSRVLAAVATDKNLGLAYPDQKDVMSVSRCIRDSCGPHRAHEFKFSFDDGSNVIYCRSPTAAEVDFLRGKLFKVEEEDMLPFEFIFHKVASVVQQNYSADTFAQIPCRSFHHSH